MPSRRCTTIWITTIFSTRKKRRRKRFSATRRRQSIDLKQGLAMAYRAQQDVISIHTSDTFGLSSDEDLDTSENRPATPTCQAPGPRVIGPNTVLYCKTCKKYCTANKCHHLRASAPASMFHSLSPRQAAQTHRPLAAGPPLPPTRQVSAPMRKSEVLANKFSRPLSQRSRVLPGWQMGKDCLGLDILEPINNPSPPPPPAPPVPDPASIALLTLQHEEAKKRRSIDAQWVAEWPRDHAPPGPGRRFTEKDADLLARVAVLAKRVESSQLEARARERAQVLPAHHPLMKDKPPPPIDPTYRPSFGCRVWLPSGYGHNSGRWVPPQLETLTYRAPGGHLACSKTKICADPQCYWCTSGTGGPPFCNMCKNFCQASRCGHMRRQLAAAAANAPRSSN